MSALDNLDIQLKMATAGLASIIASNGSHESFHSTYSNPKPNLDAQVAAADHTTVPEDAALQLHDVETFLNEPETIALLATAGSSNQRTGSPGKQRASVGSGSSSAEPIVIGTSRTSHHVSLLYHECQQRGLSPDFEFEGVQNGFQGSVTINGQIFSSDQQWPNKKEVKESLSEKALPFVKALALDRQDKKPSAGVQENWIGKLLGKAAYLCFRNSEQPIPVLTNAWGNRISQCYITISRCGVHGVCSTRNFVCLYLSDTKPSNSIRKQSHCFPQQESCTCQCSSGGNAAYYFAGPDTFRWKFEDEKEGKGRYSYRYKCGRQCFRGLENYDIFSESQW